MNLAPGTAAPCLGIYRCKSCGFEITCTLGDSLPPANQCAEHGKLRELFDQAFPSRPNVLTDFYASKAEKKPVVALTDSLTGLPNRRAIEEWAAPCSASSFQR